MSVFPRISVIIPVWNGEARIGGALEALQRQTAPAGSFEVIVVDNGSTDRTAEIVRGFDRVTLLFEPEPGSYRARNLGLAEASGDFVLFTDADCVPAEDWIEQAVRISAGPGGHRLTAGRVRLFREEGAGRFASQLEELHAFNQEANVRNGYCVTANWLCRRDLLLGLGGFRADMLSGGDVECSRRMIDAGHSLCFASELVVGHPIRATLKDLIAKRRRVFGGLWLINEGRKSRIFRMLYRATGSFVKQCYLIARSDIGLQAKPAVMAVALIVAVAAVFETFRLMLGGAPYRS